MLHEGCCTFCDKIALLARASSFRCERFCHVPYNRESILAQGSMRLRDCVHRSIHYKLVFHRGQHCVVTSLP
jgi:hypothetical protein